MTGDRASVLTDAAMLQDRVVGAVLGTACGDALGAPFEGAHRVDAGHLARWMSAADKLHYTDDTAMTIALAEFVLTLEPGERVDEQRLVEVFAEHWRREPWRGYGSGPPTVFRLLREGMRWDEAAVAPFPPDGSWGNGAAMRVAPVAAIGFDLSRVVAEARASARTTHPHPLGQDGAAVQAAATWAALHSDPSRPIDADAYLDTVAAHCETAEFVDALETVRRLARDATPARAAAELGNGVAALNSVPTAILAFLRHPDDVVETLRFAVHAGGDTDTIAAMAGASAGARHGIRAIPSSWLLRLENAFHLRRVATRLGHALNQRRPA
jgi:poly(ADP-ribose) glycohydrolase ARH3